MLNEFIASKLLAIKNTVEYHYNIFGIKSALEVNSHLNIKDDIFYLTSIFSSFDNSLDDKRMKLLLDDILNLIKYFENINCDESKKLTYDNKNLNELYKEYTCMNEEKKSFEDFTAEYYESLAVLRTKIVPIVNTKIFYLDLILWGKARKSKKILKLLRDVGANDSFSTKDFIKHKQTNFESMIAFKYIVPKSDNRPVYSKKDIEFIRSLSKEDKTINEVYEENFNRLIAVKNKINIFKKMEDGDIRLVVKEINFIKYNPHETIIKEGEVNSEIYFLVSGTCRVTANHKPVGAINEHQVFGEFSAISKDKRAATVKTNTIVTVLSFKLATELFNDIPESFSVLYKNIIDELIEKINLSNKKKF